jgi:pimeloyl-ACP methyl ester carboxylesterase
MYSSSALSENAEIFYDVIGEGPYLIMVSGAGGNSARYEDVATQLSNHFTVVRYDRRCNSRSGGNSELALDMAQQARDVVAILDALEVKTAFLFGNSGGANIAINVVELFPERILGLVAHEPPTLSVLPDATEWISFSDKVCSLFKEEGPKAAMMMFGSALKGVPLSALSAGAGVGDAASKKNLGFFLTHELASICRYKPNVEKLRRAGCPLVFVAGASSGDAYYARTADILATLTGGQSKQFLGHHISFVTDPIPFSEDILRAFQDMNVS